MKDKLTIENGELRILPMGKANPVREKSYLFALKIVNTYREIADKQREFVLSKQLLRSGTSIGANVEEALQGQSRKDFVAKLSIALKEAHETFYWLRILRDGKYLQPDQADLLLKDANELIRLLTSIIKTTRSQSSAPAL